MPGNLQQRRMMPGEHLYEYAVIRFVPNPARQEFINVGLIMFCKQQHWLKAQHFVNTQKALCLAPGADIALLEKHLLAFGIICRAEAAGGDIARLDTPERFRWLTAVRSTTIQSSPVHPGYTNNLEQKFEHLFNTLVL